MLSVILRPASALPQRGLFPLGLFCGKADNLPPLATHELNERQWEFRRNWKPSQRWCRHSYHRLTTTRSCIQPRS